MKSKVIYLATLFLFITSSSLELVAQETKDTTAVTTKKKKSKFKAYDEIITDEAVSDIGLFTTHKVGDKYYYEVPFNRLGDDMLLVSRIAKIAPGIGGGYVNAGSKTNEQLVRWHRVENSIHLKSISFNAVANDTLPIHISVMANNYDPVLAAFKIETFNPDSTAAVIMINDLFLTDIQALSGLSDRLRKEYKVKSLDKKRSYISRMSSYPENVEVRHDMTYSATSPPANSRAATISLQMSQSMYLLPEEPMQSRLYDPRVGWFTTSQVDYGSEALKADRKTYLRRWKLIPKDIKAYNRGKLVEPIKPIVYYLDPATPRKWRKYFIQGIEDWQVAFEAAGFKNAIIAKEAPTKEEDPDWSAEDARYSTVRYVATTTRNAMGPSVSDPRSGEIIESDIVWYHNHLRSYRNRYLLETGGANPKARSLDTPEAEIGEMMRMVISHEIGHALGLPHNMKASYAYPTDSLRSASFTNEWGLASTLMDYTRYNYVAQPGDTGVRWIRMLGPYDLYAINYGYRYLSDADSPEAEKPTLNKWINEKKGDPVYLFGPRNSFDPSSQTESVGDDPIKASTYGLNNLKIVAPNLAKWTATPGEGYDDLEELYGELISVWSRYVGHVVTNVGGVYELLKTTDQAGMTYTHTNKTDQVRAMEFLNQHVFTTPTWLLQENILKNIEPSGSVERIKNLQGRQLTRLLNMDRLHRVINNEAINGSSAYALVDVFKDLRMGLWSELSSAQSIDAYRRNLQRAHIVRLGQLMEQDIENRSDVGAVSRGELKAIKEMASSASSGYTGMNQFHLNDIVALIDDMLDEE